jgi:ssDNA-binding Zn-finger/Zn-ribbon topoisomerase 1
MNEREFRWYEGKHGEHPDACTCPVCCEKRRKKEEKEKFGGKIECPMCGYLSVNWVERRRRYVCSNPECGISGETLFELSHRKAGPGD